ncbi:hypothetical protein [Mesoflavibacter zeaxanthinifaciens]|uniref:hypothetical protein n=1 Tax=Mesoflavibacter zeaxanthinifaciens TaxID=393060 RepID=UPI0026F12A1A|nr:hypothetical protein [Mesoflavibacter zeaxanthinifaciens]
MFEKVLDEIKTGNQKLTIILGSGFHNQALGNLSILSNWEVLLSKLDNGKNLSKKYTLDFEQILVNQTNNQDLSTNHNASKIEHQEIKRIGKFLEEEQKWVLSQPNRFKYPNLFNPKYVSDVISLNFDHIAEELCKKQFGLDKQIKWQNKSSFSEIYKENSVSSIYRCTSFRELTDDKGNNLRFWYPHGSILRPNTITLGVNKYSRLVSDTIRIRNHFKKNEREKNENDLTWFSQIIQNPVLILGASISEAEWGLWSALVYKKKNFSKPSNLIKEKLIFKMMSEDESKTNNFWFDPLFKNRAFEDQWNLLQKMLTD